MSLHDLCRDILTGEAEPEDLGPNWDRTMSFHFYNIAKNIMDNGIPGWREILDRDHPPRISELIKLECIRIYRIRQYEREKNQRAAKVQRSEQKTSAPGWQDWV